MDLKLDHPICTWTCKAQHAGYSTQNKKQKRYGRGLSLRLLLNQFLLLALFATHANSEIVETVDGRTIDLKADGTFEIVDTKAKRGSSYVEFTEPYFLRHQGEYNQNRIRFMPKFKNTSDKKITGLKFTARFLNAFGDEIFAFSGETDEQVPAGKSTKSTIFYYFEDNQFMGGQPYDKLLPMITNNSANIDIQVDMIAFSDGEIIKLSN
ncbi:hypothetical protein [Planktotalea sp.]|uniref:hypothetical protein n=1 Tax=Planktotalea sp. TaxID=2029877 RepID=UPI003F6B1176